MGCVCGKPVDSSAKPVRAVEGVPSRNPGKNVSVGTPVKQVTADERRAKQLAAAEERARKEAQRGLAPGSRKAEELSDTAKRQELIGRIQAHYAGLHQDVPMGLNLASPEQLRKHLDAIKRAGGTNADVLDS